MFLTISATILLWSIIPPPRSLDVIYPALNNSKNTNIVKVREDKKPASDSSYRLYQGIELSREYLRGYLERVFTQYGIADEIPEAISVVDCESSWNWWASNGVSFGLTEFTPATWKEFGYGDIFNPQTQLLIMAKLWKNGQQYRWDCFCAIHHDNAGCKKRRL